MLANNKESREMKIRITEIKEVIYEPDLDNYDQADRTPEGVVAMEKENCECDPFYMHLFDNVTTKTIFELIEK